MNPELMKMLLAPMFIKTEIKQEDTKEYFEDDFIAMKRGNRIFTNKQKEQCWSRANKIPSRDPDRWRFDAAGNPVLKALRGCNGPLCHEYDHIVPYSKGGETIVRNCQILQTYTNKYKGNRTDLSTVKLQKHSVKTKLSDYEMDLVEELIYGSVKKI